MADPILLTAQISSVITSVIGIIILIYFILSFMKLTPDPFRNLIIFSIVFFAIFVISVSTMSIYHLTEGSSFQSLHELSEMGWIISMFIILILSIVESVRLRSFAKGFDV